MTRKAMPQRRMMGVNTGCCSIQSASVPGICTINKGQSLLASRQQKARAKSLCSLAMNASSGPTVPASSSSASSEQGSTEMALKKTLMTASNA
ncbi:MAG: hypothetical protein EB036_00170 [Betaproteobacteria bacterium]|nr:hypothetical protein [Betaproteobacteria bacterium]NDE91780.1 hypothetical protein [Betaproteobacteria bacterium]